jgi:hypothetical protein
MSINLAFYVDVALDDGPFVTSPTWTTLPDAELQAITIQKGRSSELENVQAGRCTIILNNPTRRFDPSNPSSPEYGTGTRLAPDRRIRVRLAFLSGGSILVEQPLFTGHIASWSTDHRTDALVSPVRIEAFDALGYLGGRTLSQSFAAGNAAARISAVLNAVGWPTGSAWRDLIAIGSPALTARSYSAASALSIIQECVQAARSQLTIKGDGRIFYDPNPPYVITPVGANVFGPTAPALPYAAAEYTIDRTNLITVARVTGATEQVATSSLGQLMPREYRASLPITDTQALSLAQTLIQRYEVPRPGVRRLLLNRSALSDNDAYNNLHEPGTCISVRTAPPVGGAETRDYIVEGAEHRIDAGTRTWTSTHLLSPAEVYA